MQRFYCRSGPATNTLLRGVNWSNYIVSVRYSTNIPRQSVNAQNTDKNRAPVVDVPKKERFKRVIKDYGATVVVFHVGISLISLGAVYTAVARSVL